MSGDESFLARWSRRKRQAEADAKAPPPAEPASAIPASGEESGEPLAFPPIESIGAGSDVTAFLVPGVPVELARAALRRAWMTDPAIRDFVGLSENSWDFNDPAGVPGFGKLDPEQVQRLVDRVFGGADPAAVAATERREAPAPIEPVPVPPAPSEPKTSTAAPQEQDKGKPREIPPRRRHGGALPG